MNLPPHGQARRHVTTAPASQGTQTGATDPVGHSAMKKHKPLYLFLAPRYWGEWLVLGIFRVLCQLPWSWQFALSRPLGTILKKLLAERREIARKNLSICFSQLSGREIRRLLSGHFRSLGMSFFEAAMAWWASDRRLAKMTVSEGLENLDLARNSGKGVILLSAHFTTVELAPRLISLDTEIDGTFRHLSLPLIDEMMYRGRSRFGGRVIDKMNMRRVIRSLREGRTMYFLPDQAHGGSNSVDAPFFGISAATNIVMTRLLESADAIVLPCLVLREPVKKPGPAERYRIRYFEPVTDFPRQPEAAAIRLNSLIENWVRQAPEQYFWVHRRFKNQPGFYD